MQLMFVDNLLLNLKKNAKTHLRMIRKAAGNCWKMPELKKTDYNFLSFLLSFFFLLILS